MRAFNEVDSKTFAAPHAAKQAAGKRLQAVIPSPFAVILIPQSREKNLRSWLRVNTAQDLRISLRVNSARNRALSIYNAVRDSSSFRSDRDSSE